MRKLSDIQAKEGNILMTIDTGLDNKRIAINIIFLGIKINLCKVTHFTCYRLRYDYHKCKKL